MTRGFSYVAASHRQTSAEKVEAEANKVNVSITVGVIDMHGNFVRQQRMNDAQSPRPPSPDLADSCKA